MAEGFVVAAPRSGSGKTLIALGLARALGKNGARVAVAKVGPDYIDPAFLSLAAGSEAVNLDLFAMMPDRARAVAARAAESADLLVVEGVMGLFDGAADGSGSTADVAAALGLPVMLVVDARGQSQSVAALAHGFARWRGDVRVAGVILNKVASARHAQMLRAALAQTGLPCLGAVPERAALAVPDRHLGLTLPDALKDAPALVAGAAELVAAHCDLDAIARLAAPVAAAGPAQRMPPLGQKIAVARDAAFSFVYAHWLDDWRAAGAEISFFSPLADQAPDETADAVFLPGGYPELHGAQLAAAGGFSAGLAAARDRAALIYGECGGYMVLGESLTDAKGQTHAMTGLLPVRSFIDAPKRTLGYRRLAHRSPLPFAQKLGGHEFHYSRAEQAAGLPPLFTATDALGASRGDMGAVMGRVMGSYAHVIDGGAA